MNTKKVINLSNEIKKIDNAIYIRKTILEKIEENRGIEIKAGMYGKGSPTTVELLGDTRELSKELVTVIFNNEIKHLESEMLNLEEEMKEVVNEGDEKDE